MPTLAIACRTRKMEIQCQAWTTFRRKRRSVMFLQPRIAKSFLAANPAMVLGLSRSMDMTPRSFTVNIEVTRVPATGTKIQDGSLVLLFMVTPGLRQFHNYVLKVPDNP